MTSIFIQSLADYNAGRIIGQWVDVTDMNQDDLWNAIKEVLAMSKEPFAEEYEIADYDGFYGLTPCMTKVLHVSQCLKQYGEAYAIYARHVGEQYATPERFEEAYCGEWSSFLDYAENLFEESYMYEVPDNIRSYIDYEKFSRDLINDYFYGQSENYNVHVFRCI